MDILELLRQREIAHPSRLVSASLSAGEFRLIIEGYPWWRDGAAPAEGRIIMRFAGITSGDLDLAGLLSADENEVLEEFEVHLTSDLNWAQPEKASIFCSAPLPNPILVFTAVQDFLATSNAALTPADFLNGGDRLSRFIEITSAPDFCLRGDLSASCES